MIIRKKIGQCQYIKIQPKTIDLRMWLWGINTEFVGFIPTDLVLSFCCVRLNCNISKLVNCNHRSEKHQMLNTLCCMYLELFCHPLLVSISLTPQMLCAGVENTILSGCHGDSGGPYVCLNSDKKTYTLHGAVSWGSGSCNAKQLFHCVCTSDEVSCLDQTAHRSRRRRFGNRFSINSFCLLLSHVL